MSRYTQWDFPCGSGTGSPDESPVLVTVRAWAVEACHCCWDLAQCSSRQSFSWPPVLAHKNYAWIRWRPLISLLLLYVFLTVTSECYSSSKFLNQESPFHFLSQKNLMVHQAELHSPSHHAQILKVLFVPSSLGSEMGEAGREMQRTFAMAITNQ